MTMRHWDQEIGDDGKNTSLGCWQGKLRSILKKNKTPWAGVLDAESQNRTGHTAIFSRVLYQLSYLGRQ